MLIREFFECERDRSRRFSRAWAQNVRKTVRNLILTRFDLNNFPVGLKLRIWRTFLLRALTRPVSTALNDHLEA